MIHPESTEARPAFEAEGSRRTFLQGTVAAAVLASVPLVGFAGKAKTASVHGKQTRLSHDNFHDLYPSWGGNNFREIQADENAHVAFLLEALGSAARPKPTFQGLTPNNFTHFVQLSATFENTGAGAYQGAAPYLSNALLPAAASIGFVEAYHSGFLNTLLNRTIVPTGGTPSNSFAPALTFAQVASALSPFIVSLNDPNNLYPFPTTTTSPQNDIAILNFALIAEYLEQEFYNINIPRFYS